MIIMIGTVLFSLLLPFGYAQAISKTDQTTWLTLTQYAPLFARALTEHAPHIRHFLLRPTEPSFTVFAPVDDGCSVQDFARGLGKSIDSVMRYHIASAPTDPELWRTGGLGGELLETGLEGTAEPKIGEPSLCHLPAGYRQRVKVYMDPTGVIKVFDGEQPPATALNIIECRDGGVVILLDRTLFPPLVVPGSVKEGTPTKAILESILQFGIADYRASPLTLFVPANHPSDPFLKNAHLSAHYVVPGVLFSEDFRDGLPLQTLSGVRLQLTDDGQDFYLNKSKILFYDVPTSFGVVHVIAEPLVPVGEDGNQETVTAVNMAQNEPVRTLQPVSALSTPACLMLAGAVAVCIAIGYVAYRRRTA